MSRSFNTFAVFAGLAYVACGDASSGIKPSEVLQFGKNPPVVWLFAVDDVGDDTGAELRARLWSDLARRISESGSCGDPAQYRSIDRRAVVMSPSGAGWVAPDSNSDLAVTTPHDTFEARSAWLDAVHRAVDDAIVAPSTSAFAFLSRLNDTVSLLVGSRLPATDEEQRLLDSLSGTRELILVSATGHDDESGGSPESFAIQLGPAAGNFTQNTREVLVFPSTDGKACDRAQLTTERYARWLAASSAGLLEQPELWRPGDSCSFVLPSATCSHGCLDSRPRISSQGTAACHIYVASDPKEGCPDSRGLTSSNASIPELNGAVCEMRQLQGSALESCRHDLQCAECEPGYCFTEVHELVGGCDLVGKVARPRFVNGAANVSDGKLYISCDE